MACIEPSREAGRDTAEVAVEPDVQTLDVDLPDLDGPETSAPDVDAPDLTPTDVAPQDGETPDAVPPDVVPPDTAMGDADSPDIVEVVDDVDDVDDVEMTDLPCLPAGCEAPDGGSCPIDSGWCWIEGVCQAEGTNNPRNGCQTCSPTVDSLKWTPRSPGAACDDGVSCTKDDACRNGTCSGITDCPGNGGACLSRTCDPGLNACVEEVINGCFISNLCYSTGTWILNG